MLTAPPQHDAIQSHERRNSSEPGSSGYSHWDYSVGGPEGCRLEDCNNPCVWLFQHVGGDYRRGSEWIQEVDRKQFEQIFAILQRNAVKEPMSSRELTTLFDAADTNKDGKLQLSEFAAFMAESKGEESFSCRSQLAK